MNGIEQAIQVIHQVLSDPALSGIGNTIAIVSSIMILARKSSDHSQKKSRVDNDILSSLPTKHPSQISSKSKKTLQRYALVSHLCHTCIALSSFAIYLLKKRPIRWLKIQLV